MGLMAILRDMIVEHFSHQKSNKNAQSCLSREKLDVIMRLQIKYSKNGGWKLGN